MITCMRSFVELDNNSNYTIDRFDTTFSEDVDA